MTRRTPLPAQLPDAFATAHAVEVGVRISRLRAADLDAPFRGARLRPSSFRGYSPDLEELQREQRRYNLLRRCRAFAAVAAQPFVFSHVTAAQLYGFPMTRALENSTAVHVTMQAGTQPPRMVGVVGHRARALHSRQVEALPVVEPVVAWSQLAPLLSLDRLTAAGDHLVRRKSPFATMDEIAAFVAAAGGTRGIRSLRAVLPDMREGTESPRETVTRLLIVRSGLPEPVVAHSVYNKNGVLVGTPDLSYLRQKIGMEYEGIIHGLDTQVFRNDIERRERFQDEGWLIIRITADHLRNPRVLIARIRKALADRDHMV